MFEVHFPTNISQKKSGRDLRATFGLSYYLLLDGCKQSWEAKTLVFGTVNVDIFAHLALGGSFACTNFRAHGS